MAKSFIASNYPALPQQVEAILLKSQTYIDAIYRSPVIYKKTDCMPLEKGLALTLGDTGLMDASSRPVRSPRRIEPAKALAVVELRHTRLTHARIAAALGLSKSTVGTVLARAGPRQLIDPQTAEPVVRMRTCRPGDMLHIDTKKLGRIVRPNYRVTSIFSTR